jgi:lysozyme
MAILQGDKGIDVSKYQVFSSYQDVANSGVKFGYVKATEGSAKGSAYVSPVMDAEFNGLKHVGIEAGFYHFARYISVADAIEEADWFIAHIKNYDFTLPPALDLEFNGCGDVTILQQATLAFLQKVEQELGSVIIYLSASYYNMVGSAIQNYGIWLADPSAIINIPKTQAQLFAWQNNWHGQVNGIQSEVDLDIACGSFFTVHNKALPAPAAPVTVAPVVAPAPVPVASAPVVQPAPVVAPAPAPKPAPAPAVPSTYTVRSGDTLGAIAVRFGLTQDELKTLNSIADPNKIFVGQILKLKKTATVPAKAPVVSQPVTYIVQSGDTLSGIAVKFGVTLQELESLNGISAAHADSIYIGQKLVIKK